MAERQTQKAQTLRRYLVWVQIPLSVFGHILTDSLDGLHSDEEKWSERLTFYIYDIAYRALKKTEELVEYWNPVMRKLQMRWLYGLDASKGNIYIDVLCANEVVSGKLEDDLVKQMCRLVMKQKSNRISEVEVLREGK